VLFVNLAVNRFDDWAVGHSWARVSPTDWSRNLKLGWEWDENGFPVNMFAHPLHGASYFNSGRSNGLTFWESVPLAFYGSFTWEYFGETHRPALNDFFMTSFGGIALGEVLHRVASSIRDERQSGGKRRVREMAAIPFDPVGSVNRALRGEWSRVGPNAPGYDPGSFVFRFAAGRRVTVDTGAVETLLNSSTLVADLQYGDIFERPYTKPFDAFTFRIQISPGEGGLNAMRASGRLFGIDLNGHTRRHRQLVVVNQRIDYVNNRAFKFGAQSVEAGLASRWTLTKGFSLRTDLFGDLVLLGALDAPSAGSGERNYDFGPGAGVRLDAALERNGFTYLSFLGRTEYVHSVSGAAADHVAGFGGLEAALPIVRGIGIGAHLLYYNRRSVYADGSQDTREYPELRLLVQWTLSGRPSGGPGASGSR
jgi:hypothetical protein